MSTENPWKTLSSKIVFESRWIKVHENQVIQPSGAPGMYGLVHFKNTAIGIVAIDDEDKIVMVGQFRYALNRYSWEIVEGGCPEGEVFEAAARRELKEEAGVVAGRLEKFFEMHLSNSVTDELAVVFIARNLKFEGAEPEDTEVLQVRHMSLNEVWAKIESGEITDAITVAAITRLKLLEVSGHRLSSKAKP